MLKLLFLLVVLIGAVRFVFGCACKGEESCSRCPWWRYW
jgi:hypothetical protein